VQAKYLLYSITQEWVKIFKETGRFSPKPICGKQPGLGLLYNYPQATYSYLIRKLYYLQLFGAYYAEEIIRNIIVNL